MASSPASCPSREGLVLRLATEADLPQLAAWNQQLIEDEGHDNTMSFEALVARMRNWLATDYQAVVFEQPAIGDWGLLDEPSIPAGARMTEVRSALAAYAVFHHAPDWIHLRQFFVARDWRRRGVGTRAVALLREAVFPSDKPVIVEAMAWNHAALTFWRTVGFVDRYVGLEAHPSRFR